jgi:hypothetical protein
MDFWIASLADGSTKEEEWLPGYDSPWQRLMHYCKKQNTYLTGLRLVMGDDVKMCPPNAIGYWQTHALPTVQGIPLDEELHKWRGIGFVMGDDVCIIWAARDPATHQTAWWRDARPAKKQAQIIWSPKTVEPGLEERLLEKSTASVRNVKNYTRKIVEEAGGVKELYIPGGNHHH